MGATPTYHLYIDDTGTRCPNRKGELSRSDGMDHFAFGGFLIKDEDIDYFDKQHSIFAKEFSLKYPLHSTKIRCKKDDFSWLKENDQTANDFYSRLNELIINSPIVATGCVVHRPGYSARYTDSYGDNKWKLCKSAYSILVERAVKFSISQNRKLAIYIENTGKRENKEIEAYHQYLRETGTPFNSKSAKSYNPISAADFSEATLKKPKFVGKDNPRMQIADLLAYAVAKGQYDSTYNSYQALINHKLLIDTILKEDEVECLGVKRYCFDSV